ncbi:MAG: WXG100 family type VII secretion target, partial [Candidatus Dormibacteraceae bacterium]
FTMGQAAQLATASADLRGAASKYVGAAAELETMAGTMSGVVHGLTTEWKGLGSAGFVTAWQAAARDAFRTIDALGGTGGAMTQMANTIDENIQAISHAETMDLEDPHGMNFGQRLLNADAQGSQALSAIQSKASSLAGQLQSVVVPLTTGGCSTGFEPLPPGGFDGVTVQPQPAGPNGPGGLPPGLVALMDGGGESGGGKGGVGIMHLLASLGVAGYQTWPDFQKDGFLSSNAWEHFMINFTVAYSVGPEASSLGKFAGFSSIEALLQTMPEIQQEIKDKKFDPTSILYILAYHTATNMTLDASGDKWLKPIIGDAGTIGATGLTDAQLEKLAGDPEKLRATLDK